MGATRHPPDVVFLEECQPLGITARAMLAALVFERFCFQNDLCGPGGDAFLDHHWAWLDDTRDFSQWENELPSLSRLPSGTHVGEHRFRTMAEQLVKTLWASIYGAPEDELTFRALAYIVERSKPIELPPLTPFKFSRFCDGGWGEPPTRADCEYWRSLRKTYARPTSG